MKYYRAPDEVMDTYVKNLALLVCLVQFLSRHLSADMYVVLGLFPFSSTRAVLHEVQLAN